MKSKTFALNRMDKSLKNIYKRSNKRKTVKSDKGVSWYKISRGGKCPDQDESNLLFNVYWKHFSCTPYDHRDTQETRGINAEQCATERLADAKQRLISGEKFDINHIRPIKIAYELGKNCLKKTLKYNSYVNKFRNYYKELVSVTPDIHGLFQKQLGNGEYPLELDVKNIINSIERKINNNSKHVMISNARINRIKNKALHTNSSNPIVYTNTKYPNTNNTTQKNKNVLYYI